MTDFRTVQQLKALDKDLAVPFSGIFVLKRKTSKTTRDGDPYLSIELGDQSGSFSTNCFGETRISSTLNSITEGGLIRLAGTTKHYKDRFSPTLQAVESISAEQATDEGVLDQLVEVPPETENELWGQLQDALEMIQHPQLKKTVTRVVSENESALRHSPAAISMHHAYRHGLLEHTVHMLRAAQVLLPLYQEVDPDLALAGIALHDIGKLEEYEGEFASRTSRLGILQGHVVIGFRTTRKAALQAHLNEDLTERLEHIILSHQGEKEWGAAAMAATPEAVFVSMIDNLDAKMGMVQRALRNTPANEQFSEFLPGLQTRILLSKPIK
jgi:3'-5' exoribonuclease